ncbi:hypothetical protein CYY_002692 [Polysphondylium violaceum]|uniref:NADH dehydrogenase [ubiquinone] iron-sulfur protein 4, mitochondrial n=1 Tax=Polysphondylium violaceum TaxID=133409 RepID=A0A8J4PYD8_9MYCE|nr:hypothetical protein CYY_002692 [Polysphondylium violaceum]
MFRYAISRCNRASFYTTGVRSFTTTTANSEASLSSATPIVTKSDLTVGNHIVIDDPQLQKVKFNINGVQFKDETVNIYRPSRNAMQTSTLGTHRWIIEIPFNAKWNDRLMGWWASKDTLNQLNLTFKSEADAVAYCKEIGLNYNIVEEDVVIRKKKKYGYRFRYRGELEGSKENEDEIK